MKVSIISFYFSKIRISLNQKSIYIENIEAVLRFR